MYVSMTSYLPTNEIPDDESGGDEVLREKFINMALLTRGRSDHDNKTHNALESEIHILDFC